MIDRDAGVDRETLAEEARAWVNHISSGAATSEDTAAMLQWRLTSPAHAVALGEAVRLRKRVIAAGAALRTEPSGQRLLSSAADRTSALTSRRAFLGGAVAASLAGMLAVRPPFDLWPSLGEMRGDYRTGVGEQRTVRIARGLTVELNTRTSVARVDGAADAYRLALIAGEVLVDAKRPAQPVRIETDHGSAQAEAGRFGVRLLDRESCVTCLAGAVAVRAQDGGVRAVLRRGQQAMLGRNGAVRLLSVDPERVDSWRRGELVFDDRPLSEVVDEINRYRPGRIVLANSALAGIPVNAVFRLDGMDRAVAQIREVANASITHLPAGVVVLS